MASFNLNYIFKGPISKYNYIGDWGSIFTFWGNTIQSITAVHSVSQLSYFAPGICGLFTLWYFQAMPTTFLAWVPSSAKQRWVPALFLQVASIQVGAEIHDNLQIRYALLPMEPGIRFPHWECRFLSSRLLPSLGMGGRKASKNATKLSNTFKLLFFWFSICLVFVNFCFPEFW